MNGGAWERVKAARSPKRPMGSHYIHYIIDDFIEFHGDRYFGDDPAIVGGIGFLAGTPVTVIAQEKGVTLDDKIRRNFGSPHPEGYRKALRLMRQAEKFHRPVICFVDTQGAYCGIGAEERGQGRAIADNLISMMGLEVPTISVIIGEGGSGGALALAVADRVAVLENAIYSILSPEGFAAIIWKDGSRAAEAAELMKLTADELYKLGVIDAVIAEPAGGAAENPREAALAVKDYIIRELAELTKLETKDLLQRRFEKYKAMGGCLE